MPRDSKVYLEDILDAIDKIRRFTIGLSMETLDAKTLDAVVRNLEVIGEAAKNVPDDIRLLQPNIEWKKVSGLRDILIHEYFGIETTIVWDVVQNKLLPLETQIRQLLQRL